LKVITTTQSPEHDIMQISRSLNIPEDRIQLIYPDPGGAFGGKEEIHVQILASLLAVKTGRPVRMELSREESNAATTRRHAFTFEIRIKVSPDMNIKALAINAIGDAGAYLSHGPGVLEVAGSHAAGPYNIPNVKFDGMVVYTNYPPSGGMRGYGASEVNFALERHIDRLCRVKGWDPVKFRLQNALMPGQQSGTGLVPISTITAYETIKESSRSRLFSMKQSSSPFIKVGVGFAAGMKSTSYGQGGDSARVRLVLGRDGVRVMFTTPDMGTGIRFAISRIVSSALGIPEQYVKVDNSNSANPRSGTSNASRVTFMIGNAVIKAAQNLKENCMKLYGTADCLEAIRVAEVPVEADGMYSLPEVKGGNYKVSDFIFSFIAAVARVEVDYMTGFVKVTDIDVFPEAGTIINPTGFISQIEGGTIMSLGYALYENLGLSGGRVMGKNFTFYVLPTAREIPKISIHAIQSTDSVGPMGAKGVGELAMQAVAPAIVNAIVDATGTELNSIPVSREKIVNHLDD
ncbi:MAG: xanthine dehydrogenase family protein molybdopterin-binding subunit, partial [Nitrososphaeria archaeon]